MTQKPSPPLNRRLLLGRLFGRLALLALCTGIFALVLALYRVPVEPALYAGALCLVPLGVVTAVSLLRQAVRHRALTQLANGLPDTLGHLPPPASQVEQDYQALLTDTAQLLARQVGEADLRYRQMTGYYTLWSHQIKTPLAAMGLLLGRQDDAQARQLLAEVQKTQHYVDLALNYARLDSPDSDYRFEPVDVREAASAAARRYAGQFVLKRLSLQSEVPEGTTVVSDRKWLVFVLEQLLSNAVKYTQAGGITIRWVEDRRELCIADSGIGIPAEDLPRVFELGFTGYTGRVEQQATGIGLYLCRQVCRRLGHELSLRSTQNEGTTAVLRFPADSGRPM